MPDPIAPAVNQLPAAVIILVLIVVLGECYIAGSEANLWGGSDARVFLIRRVAFLPEVFQRSLTAGIWVPELFVRLITYPFVHGSLMQAIFASVFTLAMGKFVGEVLGNFAIILIFFNSAIFAALGYAFFTDDTFPLFGGFPAAYGLIGAFTFVLFSRTVGILSQQFLAFRLLAILMIINITFALFQNGPALWVAELSAAITGFASAAIIHPNGLRFIINKFRSGRR